MKNLYLFLVSVCIVFATQAQEYFESLPENPGPNVCFAKCVVPDEYREEVVRVMTKPVYCFGGHTCCIRNKKPKR
jgi:hypothetical protein